jgi:hypothetical protein
MTGFRPSNSFIFICKNKLHLSMQIKIKELEGRNPVILNKNENPLNDTNEIQYPHNNWKSKKCSYQKNDSIKNLI